ncbi:unnamed protein product [Boreogadus saida]
MPRLTPPPAQANGVLRLSPCSSLDSHRFTRGHPRTRCDAGSRASGGRLARSQGPLDPRHGMAPNSLMVVQSGAANDVRLSPEGARTPTASWVELIGLSNVQQSAVWRTRPSGSVTLCSVKASFILTNILVTLH